jgi:hypothetical protein
MALLPLPDGRHLFLKKMKERIKIIDESNDRLYFTIVPNYVLDNSSAVVQALYAQIKRLAGDRGTTKCSRDFLCRKLNITKPTLLKTIKYLLDHNWIYEAEIQKVQTAGGKQKMKSYGIVDLWGRNFEFYDKGGKKETPPFNQKGVKNNLKGGKKETHKEEPVEEELVTTDIPDGISGKELNELIDLFEPLNPFFQDLFKNKTEREALRHIAEKLTTEKTRQLLMILPDVCSRPFFPKITKPTELKRDLGKIIQRMREEKSKKINITI